ncbi:MAG: rRNA pseudouridine synthase [Ruminococcus sp.]|nr:rRNA pseudouridine synthase [Ruminococcus sp.]
MNQIRLDKFVSERSEYSRSQIKNLVKKGEIRIDGAAAKSSDVKIDPENQKITVCGTEIIYRDKTYVLLNKPAGYVCSTDPKDGRIVMELIPPQLRTKGMFPAGRLDKDSVGALLLTDDGELAHKILSPKSHISKIYIVKLANCFENNYINLFKNGICLSDGCQCLPAKLRPSEKSEKLAFVELFEGKYHQVKRMFSSVGNHVDFLMRISLGSLVLPEKLGIGESMELLHKDVENLFRTPDFDDFCREFDRNFSAIVIKKLI